MRNFKVWIAVGVFVVAILTLGIATSFYTKEDKVPAPTDTGISENEISNEAFQKKFPEQYASYMKTSEMSDTTYAGSVRRSKFSKDKEPYLPILFSGYGFATDYQEDRGHYYTLEDIQSSLRVTDKTPGACLTCKSSAVPQLIERMGEKYWTGSFKNEVMPAAEKTGHSAIGCSDCHNPKTMELRVTRPSFIQKMADKGINVRNASKEEMRNYVCGQCHAEYYFHGETGEVVHPWQPGYDSISMYVYYETRAKTNSFERDYVSTISGTPMLKAQHPDFETFIEGPHANRNVSCADCHMPMETTASGKKITSHQLTSPLKSMEKSCGSCHSKGTTAALKMKVEETQSKFKEELDEAEELSVQAHYYVNKMITSGADSTEIEKAQTQIRFGQWHWDYCAAENSTGFHNPEKSLDSLRISKNASNEAIAIATAELKKKKVNLKELNAEIDKVKKAVVAEKDMTKKKDYTTNAYFPAQQQK